MADWYCSSTAYAAVPQWQANTAYTVGQFVRSLAAPNVLQNWTVHRCTTAGTTAATEPGWDWSNGGVTTSGGASFTNVTGREAYGWAAASGNLWTFGDSYSTRIASGDRVFVSSDHTESIPGGLTIGQGGYAGILFISVNRAGSVPPVAADVQPGATITHTGGAYWEGRVNEHFEGFTFNMNSFCNFNNGSIKQFYFKDCTFILNSNFGRFASNNPGKLTWDNCKCVFTALGQGFNAGYAFDFTWINSPNATLGSTAHPTNLFYSPNQSRFAVTCRGVDFSAFNGGFASANSASGGIYVLLDSCKVSPSAIRLVGASNGSCGHDEIELNNCDQAGSPIYERVNTYGTMSTDRATVMASGAVDLGGVFSFKLITLALGANNPSKLSSIETLFFDVENTVIGTPRTATVQILSSQPLTTADIRLTLSYPNVAGSVLLGSVCSRPTELTPAAVLPTSAAAWTNIPATPNYQYLRVPFTAAASGRVRGRVQLMKQNTTVWVNPQLVLA